MLKLNKKGVTLIELIVSFALVATAVIYFYQTLSTVYDLYVTSRKETQEYVDKDYAIRIVDAYVNANGYENVLKICDKYIDCYDGINFDSDNNIITIKKDGEEWVKYYTIVKSNDEEQLIENIKSSINDILNEGSIQDINEDIFIIDGVDYVDIKPEIRDGGIYGIIYIKEDDEFSEFSSRLLLDVKDVEKSIDSIIESNYGYDTDEVKNKIYDKFKDYKYICDTVEYSRNSTDDVIKLKYNNEEYLTYKKPFDLIISNESLIDTEITIDNTSASYISIKVVSNKNKYKSVKMVVEISTTQTTDDPVCGFTINYTQDVSIEYTPFPDRVELTPGSGNLEYKKLSDNKFEIYTDKIDLYDITIANSKKSSYACKYKIKSIERVLN